MLIVEKMNKILFIEYTDFEGHPIGGQKNYIRNLIHNLPCIPFLVGIGPNNKVGQWSKKKIRGKYYDYFTLPERTHSIFPLRFLFLYDLMRFKHKIIFQDFDAIFIQSPETAFPFLFSITKKNKIIYRMAGGNNPLTLSKFSFARNSFFLFLYNFVFIKTVIKHASIIIAINSECLDLIHNISGDCLEKTVLSSVAVDSTRFFPAPDKLSVRYALGLPADAAIFIFVGRLEEVKGLDLLFDSLIRLRETFSDKILLILCGDGSCRKRLQHSAISFDIKDLVLFTGVLDHEVLAKYLRAADVFVMSSFFEGLPNVILEAMACALPVVSTDVGGVSRIVKNNINGCLVKSRDSKSYSEAMIFAYENRIVFGNFSLETVRSEFTIESVAKSLQQVIDMRI